MSSLGRSLRLAASLGLVAGAAACMESTEPTPGPLPPGSWGGDHIQLTVAADGATTNLDCAHGTIEQPIATDRSGSFAAAGHHVFEHGGPVHLNDPPDSHPARYQGRIVGDVMTLTITLTDTLQDVGTFSLTRNAAGRVVKCL